MNSQEFVQNKNLWFSASDGWREMMCPVAGRRLVVIVPHPDDEIFGCAGLLQNWAKEASETVIVYVTSGDASHGYQLADEKAELARIRRMESQKAMAELELGLPLTVMHLELSDSQVASQSDRLKGRLRSVVDANSIVIAPYDEDGHADHNAIGACARALAAEVGFEVHFYPIWLWFWRGPQSRELQMDFCKLSMNPKQLERKVRAIDRFDSQILSVEGRSPVIPDEFLQHYKTLTFEVLVN